MAVAVKTSPGARSTGPLASPAILSLVGLVYLLACLAIVFKLIPDLWWMLWVRAGLSSYAFVGGTLLALLALGAGIGLLILGSRLLGPNPPVGVRAGVFVAFVGLLLVVLLTRWASVWLEYWAYNQRIFSESTGFWLTGGVGAVLLLGWLRWFTLSSTQQMVKRFEEGGWFHATSYKANQGQKVRRGTIIGLLLIVGAGIWTLLNHNTLAKGPKDWGIYLPFTGRVAVQSYGDALPFLAELPASAKREVQIRWPGRTKLKVGETLRFDEFRALLESPLLPPEASEGMKASLRTVQEQVKALLQRESEPATFLLALNKEIFGAKLERLLSENFYSEGVKNRLETVFHQTPWEDLGSILADFAREAETVVRDNRAKEEELGGAFLLPSAVLLIDRYALRDVNDQMDEAKNVKILLKGDSTFKEGEMVSREAFDQEVARLEAEREKGRFRTLPTRTPLLPATGPTQYASFTLLPSVEFTVPLLLLAGSLWLAWRVVNMPTFADFLIATEAELNKVSWTTQKKLVQDTIVVLVTVFLMAVFLFGMDWAWKVVLSWKPIGVLHIPKESSQQNKPFEQKKW